MVDDISHLLGKTFMFFPEKLFQILESVDSGVETDLVDKIVGYFELLDLLLDLGFYLFFLL
jgi:hypothetical protein